MPKNENVKYGDKVLLKGEYGKAEEFKNYKAFNYNEYLKEKNIYGSINVKSIEVIEKNNLNYVSLLFNKLRNKIKDNLKEILGEQSKVTIGILLRRYFRNSRKYSRKF